MMEVRAHVLMDTLVVSVWCRDRAIGHDHCIASGRATLWNDQPEEQLMAVGSYLVHVQGQLLRGELDEYSGDCWQP